MCVGGCWSFPFYLVWGSGGLLSTVQTMLAHELLEMLLCLPHISHRCAGVIEPVLHPTSYTSSGDLNSGAGGCSKCLYLLSLLSSAGSRFEAMKSAFSVERLHAVLFWLATRRESLLPGCLPKWVLKVQPTQPKQPKETMEERDKISLFADKD